MSVTVVLRTDRLQALIRNIPTRARTVVDETADDVRGRANSAAPRDTGSLAESLYISNSGGASDYAQRAGSARARNSAATIVQEVRPEFVLSLFGGSSSNAYLSVIGAAVAHGVFQELGTVHMGPQPFLIPSIEGVSGAFVSAMGHVLDV